MGRRMCVDRRLQFKTGEECLDTLYILPLFFVLEHNQRIVTADYISSAGNTTLICLLASSMT